MNSLYFSLLTSWIFLFLSSFFSCSDRLKLQLVWKHSFEIQYLTSKPRQDQKSRRMCCKSHQQQIKDMKLIESNSNHGESSRTDWEAYATENNCTNGGTWMISSQIASHGTYAQCANVACSLESLKFLSIRNMSKPRSKRRTCHTIALSTKKSEQWNPLQVPALHSGHDLSKSGSVNRKWPFECSWHTYATSCDQTPHFLITTKGSAVHVIQFTINQRFLTKKGSPRWAVHQTWNGTTKKNRQTSGCLFR